MIVWSIIIIIITVYEGYYMKNNNLNKEKYVYALLTGITVVIGYIYIANPLRKSISILLLELFGYL